MGAIYDPYRVKHIFYWICDKKSNIRMIILILYIPSFLSEQGEKTVFQEILKSESVGADLNGAEVEPVSDTEEGTIFDHISTYTDDTTDLFEPEKISSAGIRYRVLHL